MHTEYPQLILHWYACGADGRRAVNDHLITKFSGMGRFTYPWCSAGARCTRRRAPLLSVYNGEAGVEGGTKYGHAFYLQLGKYYQSCNYTV